MYINLTPHKININDGTSFPPSGNIARVSVTFSEIVDGECRQQYSEVEGIPSPKNGVRYIVSGLVLGASDRGDIVAPATGHPSAIRNNEGHIISVPCFVKN